MKQFLFSVGAVILALTATSHASSAQGAGSPPASPAPAMSAAPSMAQPSGTPEPANPPEDPLVTARVRQAFLAWQGGHIDRAAYSRYAGGSYPDEFVSVVAPDLAAIGAPQAITYRTASLLLGDMVYRYEVLGATGTVSVLYALDQSGRTDDIIFTPIVFRAAPKAP